MYLDNVFCFNYYNLHQVEQALVLVDPIRASLKVPLFVVFLSFLCMSSRVSSYVPKA